MFGVRLSLSGAVYNNQGAVAVNHTMVNCSFIVLAMTIFCRKVETCLALVVVSAIYADGHVGRRFCYLCRSIHLTTYVQFKTYSSSAAMASALTAGRAILIATAKATATNGLLLIVNVNQNRGQDIPS